MALHHSPGASSRPTASLCARPRGRLSEVDGRIAGHAACDAVILTAPFVADTAAFLDGFAGLPSLIAALRRQHRRGSLIATYCSGSFVLAEACLLDGQAATTHWAKASAFKKRYPRGRYCAPAR